MKIVIEGQKFEIEHIAVQDLHPDDMIVVKTHISSFQESERATDYVKQIFPNNKVMVLPEDTSLEIVKTKEIKS